MKINIDTDKLDKKKLTINQYLLLLKIHYQLKGIKLDFTETKSDYLLLRDSGFIEIDGSNVILTERSINFLDDSKFRDYDELAHELRMKWPAGLKGGKWAWRATVKDLASRLQKLDKNHGMIKYTDEQILSTADGYIRRFRTGDDMDRGMQVCKYFIEKDGTSALMELLEVIDERDTKIVISKPFIKKL